MSKNPHTFKVMVIFYALLVLFLKAIKSYTEINIGILDFPTLQLSTDVLTLFGIPNFILGVFGFIASILLFSTPFWYINIMLWGIRIIIGLELVLYFKSALHPTAI